ncbi:hypothetical protein KEM56_001834 [Ascosphaera pollenicola]|nr:hypothetical protein KEM56_001834 [Ascosphaera pollenicola]
MNASRTLSDAVVGNPGVLYLSGIPPIALSRFIDIIENWYHANNYSTRYEMTTTEWELWKASRRYKFAKLETLTFNRISGILYKYATPEILRFIVTEYRTLLERDPSQAHDELEFAIAASLNLHPAYFKSDMLDSPVLAPIMAKRDRAHHHIAPFELLSDFQFRDEK